MAKRFTDTDVWDKEWFMALSPTLKCLVKYVRDKCNIAGVWHPNYRLASTYIGEKVSESDLLSIDGGKQFLKLDCGKIFCIGFINFQYGENLSEKAPVHKKIIESLKKHFHNKITLYDTHVGRVAATLQEEDKEEEKDLEMDKGGAGEIKIDPAALVPKMLMIWKKKKPDYPEDQSKDFPALNHISSFICKKLGLSYQPRDGDVTKSVLDHWQIITDYVSEEPFFKNYSLQQVDKHIQSIIQKIQNGQSDSKATGDRKVTGQQLNTSFTKFYSQKQSA